MIPKMARPLMLAAGDTRWSGQARELIGKLNAGEE